jgi:hypothetical protein
VAGKSNLKFKYTQKNWAHGNREAPFKWIKTGLSYCNSIINQIPSNITSEINRKITYGVINVTSRDAIS